MNINVCLVIHTILEGHIELVRRTCALVHVQNLRACTTNEDHNCHHNLQTSTDVENREDDDDGDDDDGDGVCGCSMNFEHSDSIVESWSAV